MQRQIEQRLQQLKTEYKSGEKLLMDLELKQTNVKETLLRISGAIQVLEEELAKNNSEASEPETLEHLETESHD
ncbi:MAG: hypothetical protein ACFKPT_02865 [Gloeotrichia echinulata GP01]